MNTHLPMFREEEQLVSFEDEERSFHLHPDAMNAWQKMKTVADSDEIHLYVVSAFRSVARQTEIIENKRNKGIPEADIFKVSAPPGQSEHHTGRAIDINTTDCPALEEEFENTSAFGWLTENAARFGFFLSYPRDNEYGIAYEPWHWCYYKEDEEN